jgi:hypothetical protein
MHQVCNSFFTFHIPVCKAKQNSGQVPVTFHIYTNNLRNKPPDVRSEVPKAVLMKNTVFWIWRRVVQWIFADVSEELVAFNFLTIILVTWRSSRQILPKRRHKSSSLYGVTCQKGSSSPRKADICRRFGETRCLDLQGNHSCTLKILPKRLSTCTRLYIIISQKKGFFES